MAWNPALDDKQAWLAPSELRVARRMWNPGETRGTPHQTP